MIAGAVVLALVAAGVLFGTDFFQKNLFGPSETELLAEVQGASKVGGYAATFAEPSAAAWRLAEGHRLERFSLNDQGAVFARLSSSKPLDAKSFDWPSLGLTWKLTQEFNNQTNGLPIEIGIVARQAATNGSNTLFVMYATEQAGNSGWKPIQLSSSFELKTIRWTVPRIEPGGYKNPPIVVLHSDATGSGKAIEILGVYVKPVSN